jgi:hypothetical protein
VPCQAYTRDADEKGQHSPVVASYTRPPLEHRGEMRSAHQVVEDANFLTRQWTG